MSIRNALLCSCVIMGSAAIPAIIPAVAHADADIIVTTAPPAMREEAIPSPRKGYVWAPGYQRWANDHYEWVAGHWVEERTDAHWVPDKWTQDPNDSTHWHFRPGHWEY